MNAREREASLEAVASAHRAVDVDGRISAAPDFWDLSAEDRELAHQRGSQLRRLEAAMDPEGLSCTGQRVLAMIRSAGRRL